MKKALRLKFSSTTSNTTYCLYMIRLYFDLCWVLPLPYQQLDTKPSNWQRFFWSSFKRVGAAQIRELFQDFYKQGD